METNINLLFSFAWLIAVVISERKFTMTKYNSRMFGQKKISEITIAIVFRDTLRKNLQIAKKKVI